MGPDVVITFSQSPINASYNLLNVWLSFIRLPFVSQPPVSADMVAECAVEAALNSGESTRQLYPHERPIVPPISTYSCLLRFLFLFSGRDSSPLPECIVISLALVFHVCSF